MSTFYTADHDSQYEPRTVASPFDCNMAAAADAARQWSLNLIDRNHDQLRRLSGTYWEVLDANKYNNGTNIAEAGRVLDSLGVRSVIRDSLDGDTFADVLTHLGRGEFVIAHGDAGSIPRELRGPIDRDFVGYHSVFLQRHAVGKVRVGDGLGSNWILWPDAVVKAYMEAFPGSGLTYLYTIPRKITSKVGTVNLRSEPVRASNVVAVLNASSRLVCGGMVLGESIGANRNWFKVWSPVAGLGYVHTSVARYI